MYIYACTLQGYAFMDQYQVYQYELAPLDLCNGSRSSILLQQNPGRVEPPNLIEMLVPRLHFGGGVEGNLSRADNLQIFADQGN